MTVNDVVIIGAGPAGLATAIQLKRYGITPIVIEKSEIGGLLKNANNVENYLGFPEGISGPKLIKLFKQHINNAGVKVAFEEVLELRIKNRLFSIKTNKKVIISRIVVIASGTKPRTLFDPKKFTKIKNRIFYEVYNLAQVKNEKIAIIGAGDAAFDYALNLANNNKVLILNRGSKVKSLPILFERVRKNRNISYMENTQVESFDYINDQLKLTCSIRKEKKEIYTSYLLIAIGREPNLDFLTENIKNKIEELQKSKVLYMVGDVKNGIYRQTSIAVGDGIKSAMQIYRTLKGEKL